MTDWLTRWQQTDDDELLYTPTEPDASPVWPASPRQGSEAVEALRQMVRTCWPELEEED